MKIGKYKQKKVDRYHGLASTKPTIGDDGARSRRTLDDLRLSRELDNCSAPPGHVFLVTPRCQEAMDCDLPLSEIAVLISEEAAHLRAAIECIQRLEAIRETVLEIDQRRGA